MNTSSRERVLNLSRFENLKHCCKIESLRVLNKPEKVSSQKFNVLEETYKIDVSIKFCTRHSVPKFNFLNEAIFKISYCSNLPNQIRKFRSLEVEVGIQAPLLTETYHFAAKKYLT